jgi:hypothetical protein
VIESRKPAARAAAVLKGANSDCEAGIEILGYEGIEPDDSEQGEWLMCRSWIRTPGHREQEEGTVLNTELETLARKLRERAADETVASEFIEDPIQITVESTADGSAFATVQIDRYFEDYESSLSVAFPLKPDSLTAFAQQLARLARAFPDRPARSATQD